MRKVYIFARILEFTERPGEFYHDINHDGDKDSWKDEERFLLDDSFDTIEEAKADLLYQGFKFSTEINLYVLEDEVEEFDEYTVVNPWETPTPKELDEITNDQPGSLRIKQEILEEAVRQQNMRKVRSCFIVKS